MTIYVVTVLLDSVDAELPYTAKLSSAKNFAVFAVFQPIAKIFPVNHLLCTVHDGNGLMHRKSFPVNNVFCAQLQKFSHSKVLPYTVYKIQALLTLTV